LWKGRIGDIGALCEEAPAKEERGRGKRGKEGEKV
jgi:hypothetical protein